MNQPLIDLTTQEIAAAPRRWNRKQGREKKQGRERRGRNDGWCKEEEEKIRRQCEIESVNLERDDVRTKTTGIGICRGRAKKTERDSARKREEERQYLSCRPSDWIS